MGTEDEDVGVFRGSMGRWRRSKVEGDLGKFEGEVDVGEQDGPIKATRDGGGFLHWCVTLFIDFLEMVDYNQIRDFLSQHGKPERLFVQHEWLIMVDSTRHKIWSIHSVLSQFLFQLQITAFNKIMLNNRRFQLELSTSLAPEIIDQVSTYALHFDNKSP